MEGSKICKHMVVLMDFPYKSALFGLVIHHDPLCNDPLELKFG